LFYCNCSGELRKNDEKVSAPAPGAETFIQRIAS
jgi:hypothetical protein